MDLTQVVTKCGLHTYSSLFPNDVSNKYLVYFINIIHIIGVIVIQFGILLPPILLKYYIIYIVFLFISYILLNNRCFMTVLSNYFGDKNYNSLCIKMNEAKYILAIYLVVSVFFFVYPKYSIYVTLQRMFR
tara:strand:- start:529 stop:921 length:393 start_codon:yes stop_codon:yes gene_type:complete